MDTYMIQDIVAQKRDLRATKDYLKHAQWDRKIRIL